MVAAVQLAGAVVATFGTVLALRAATLLLGRGRPQRGPRPAFVLAGPYLRMRNPLYAGVVIAVAGIGVVTRSVPTLVLAMAIGVAAHAWVERREEPRLRASFGRAYEEYCRRVPRWVPGRRGPSPDPDVVP